MTTNESAHKKCKPKNHDTKATPPITQVAIVKLFRFAILTATKTIRPIITSEMPQSTHKRGECNINFPLIGSNIMKSPLKRN